LRIAETLVCDDQTINTHILNDYKLQHMNLNPIGYPIDFYWSPYATVIDFIEEQYACSSINGDIRCEPGDYVVDGGACWGDTALYFASKTGDNGRVFSFEFLDDNIAIFNRNLDMNPDLAKVVKLLPNALWSRSGDSLSFAAGGPGTCLVAPTGKANESQVKTISIDDLVGSGMASRIDFIKMDIEGAELEALKGAELTLKKFKPKLAITVYHHFYDYWQIPQFIDSLNLGYRFEMRHFTFHAEETVLYAKAI
jgi:FkbM family methyltransferase